jgi:glycosyltransferase involved in cell wall biosynthesis
MDRFLIGSSFIAGMVGRNSESALPPVPKDKVNVLQLISSSGLYGAEKVVLHLSKEFKKDPSCRPFVGVFDNQRNPHLEMMEECRQEGIDATAFPCSGQIDFTTIRMIRRFIREKRIDILHTHGYKADSYGRFASMGLPVGLIATCHNWLGNEYRSKLYAEVDLLILRWFDLIAAVSKDIQGRVVRNGVPAPKVWLIRNGVPLENFEDKHSRVRLRREMGIPQNAIVIGTVGRISYEKGHRNLFIAAQEIIADIPDVFFLVVGDGPLREELQEKYFSPSILFAGYRQEAPRLYQCMDIFVLPSLMEGLPMALLEAMAARLPVVATRVGEIPSLVGSENGILVEPNNPESLKHGLVYLIRNFSVAAALGEKAYLWVKSHFSSENMARRYMEGYADVLRAKRKKGGGHFEGRSISDRGDH